MKTFKLFVTEGLAQIVKDGDEYVFINPSGKEALRVSDKERAMDWKTYYMRKKRWKFKGDVNAEF